MASNPVYQNVGENGDQVKIDQGKEDTHVYESLEVDTDQGGRRSRTRLTLIIVFTLLAMIVIAATAGFLGWFFGSRTNGEHWGSILST